MQREVWLIFEAKGKRFISINTTVTIDTILQNTNIPTMNQSHSMISFLFLVGILAIQTTIVSSFTFPNPSTRTNNELMGQRNEYDGDTVSRRSFFSSTLVPASAFLVSNSVMQLPSTPAFAADGKDNDAETPTVQTPLYFILRVREATEQEARLIKSGKFKDVQRANVKLAIKFMIDNYRLNDNFISASAFLNGDRKIKAVDIGQTTIQNLNTILEYFDTSDIENIKVCLVLFSPFFFHF